MLLAVLLAVAVVALGEGERGGGGGGLTRWLGYVLAGCVWNIRTLSLALPPPLPLLLLLPPLPPLPPPPPLRGCVSRVVP